MTAITLKGNTIHTNGELPALGAVAPAFTLTDRTLAEVTLESYGAKRKLLNVFPSLDTPVCAASIRAFNSRAAAIENLVVLAISADLPFAHQRFCTAEGIEGVEALSSFRSSFASDYGLLIVDGPLKGLCSRAVLILDGENRLIYNQQVPEIAIEPDYEAAMKAIL